jgi:hypothetical protein
MKRRQRSEHGRSPHRERRGARRRPAADYPAEVCWIVGGQLRRTAAVLLDISASGTLVLADELPPEQARLLLRLRWPVRSAWVEARLVAGHPTRLGPSLLRVTFPAPPSRHFLASATRRPTGRN